MKNSIHTRFSQSNNSYVNSKIDHSTEWHIRKKLSLCRYQTIQSIEGDIRNTFKDQMNQFIQRKVKSFTIKRQEQLVKNPNNKSINHFSRLKEDNDQKEAGNPQQIRIRLHKNQPINVQKMRVCQVLGKVQRKTQRMIAEPYVVNNKEKIRRIISLRMEQEDTFNKMKKTIRDITNSRYRLMRKEETKINELDQLIQEVNHKSQAQHSRYQKRLLVKHRNKYKSLMTL